MAVKYNVYASVVNIENDSPRNEDSFFVDTNVWLWMCYGRASLSLDLNVPQLTKYPPFIKKIRTVGARLHRSGLSFAELSHVIEKIEYEHFSRIKGLQISLKEFRHNYSTERANVVGEVTAAWQQVKEIASIIELSLNDATTDLAVNRLQNQLVDGYDLFFLESLSAAGQVQIISNDGDFCTVPNITLFTANPSVISAAANQGKLVTR